MLEMSDDSVLEFIAEHIGALIDVDLVVVAVPHGHDDLRVTAVQCLGATSLRGRIFPAAGTLAARALATQRAASVVGDADQAPVDWQPGSGPTVAIPCTAVRSRWVFSPSLGAWELTLSPTQIWIWHLHSRDRPALPSRSSGRGRTAAGSRRAVIVRGLHAICVIMSSSAFSARGCRCRRYRRPWLPQPLLRLRRRSTSSTRR